MNNFQIPPQLMQMMKSGISPQQMLMNIVQNNNTPMMQNITNIINNRDGNGLEQFARNLCKSKGIDADEMYKQIHQRYM